MKLKNEWEYTPTVLLNDSKKIDSDMTNYYAIEFNPNDIDMISCKLNIEPFDSSMIKEGTLKGNENVTDQNNDYIEIEIEGELITIDAKIAHIVKLFVEKGIRTFGSDEGFQVKPNQVSGLTQAILSKNRKIIKVRTILLPGQIKRGFISFHKDDLNIMKKILKNHNIKFFEYDYNGIKDKGG